MAQDATDQYLAVNNSDSGSTDDIQNLTTGRIPPRQRDECASGEALDIVATLGDGEMEMDGHSAAVRDGSDTTGQPQARMSDAFQSHNLTATIATPFSLTESGDDLERPKQMAEVVDADQEWEIRDTIGKEDIDGVPHYWVEWMPTLVPKYHLRNARALVNTFEARLRAGRGRGRDRERGREQLPTSKAVVGVCRMQQKKQRGRPRKQYEGS